MKCSWLFQIFIFTVFLSISYSVKAADNSNSFKISDSSDSPDSSNNFKISESLYSPDSSDNPDSSDSLKISNTEGLPKWELGLGVIGVNQAQYTGSNQSRFVLLPIPIPIYRGEKFKSDDDGVRIQLLESGRVSLELSTDFSVQLDSDDADLREGLDDIGNLLEIGPSIGISLNKTKNGELNLNLPVRGTVEIGSNGINTRGFIFAPDLTYKRNLAFAGTSWATELSVGPRFGNANYNDTYYGVDASGATENRSAFDVDGGYSGSRLQLIMKSNNRKRLIIGFIRYENINGATFDDSPLVETNDNLTIGFLYSRYLFKSKQRIKRK